MSDITSRSAQLGSENSLISSKVGEGADPAAIFYQASGSYNGEKVASLPQANAAGWFESVENLAESGATATMQRAPQGTNVRSKPVSGRGNANESRDTNSSTAEGEEPEALAKRISSMVDAFDGGTDMGGNSGHGGGSDTSQQHQQRSQMLQSTGSVDGSSSRQSAIFVDRLRAIRDGALDILSAQRGINQGQLIESVMDSVRAALGELSLDQVQQLTTLEIARSHFSGSDDIFSRALDALQQEYDRFDTGGHLRMAVRNTFDTINAVKAARATMETDPAAVREYQRQKLRENDRALDKIIASLDEAHPKMSLQGVMTDYIGISGHEMSGSDSAGIDKEFLHSLLSEIRAIKLLNSVYDLTLELIHNTGLQEDETLNVKSVMRPNLQFVAEARPQVDESIDKFSAVLPENLELEKRILYSTNLAKWHDDLPDQVFPGLVPLDQADAREAQKKVIKIWRGALAEEENELYASPAVTQKKVPNGSPATGTASAAAA